MSIELSKKMKETSKIPDIFSSIVRRTKEEFEKIKLEDINILKQLVNVHGSSRKTKQTCFKSENHQSKPSCQEHTESRLGGAKRKFNFNFCSKDGQTKIAERAKSSYYSNAANKTVNKQHRGVSSRHIKEKKLTRSVSRTGKRTLPSSPIYKTKRFDLNRLSSKRRKLPQLPEDSSLHQDTISKEKAKDQEVTKKQIKDDKERNECSSAKHRRPLGNVLAQDGFVRPAAWASIRPLISKQSIDVPFCIPTKQSPVCNRSKGSETITLKNENTEYHRSRLLSFRTFFRREYDILYDLDKNTSQRSQRNVSAADELKSYLVNKKV